MVLLSILACSPVAKETAKQEVPESLTVESWEQLPTSVKFDGATLEQLRADVKRFHSQRTWLKFYKEVVRKAEQEETQR